MIQPAKPVLSALARLENAGYPAYIVGGAVRDALRGISPHDYDLCTAARPQETIAVFAGERVVETGLRHGTVTVLLDGMPLEITTFRVESGYSDKRHPDHVRFVRTVEEDLSRRDFTINAIAYSPYRGLADPFGGQTDIINHTLRAVRNPYTRFSEDSLRILRGLRLAAQTGFAIESVTEAALYALAPTLAQVAPERVSAELLRLLCGRYAGQILRKYTDILGVIMPELLPMRGFQQHNAYHLYDVLEHTLRVLEQIPAQPALRLAALLHDAGKPDAFTMDENGVGHFYGHPKISAALAEQRCLALRLPAALRETVVSLVRIHDVPIEQDIKSVRRRLAQHGETRLRQLLMIKKADCVGRGTHAEYIGYYQQLAAMLEETLRQGACLSVRSLALNGHDLMALGLHGKAVGEMQRWLLSQVLDDPARNTAEKLSALAQIHMEEL